MGDTENKEENTNFATELLHHLVVQNKRVFIALMITLAMLFMSNLAWLWVFQSYDYASYDVESHDGGHANYIGNDGDINNGESESVPKNQTQRTESEND